jgi:hypothetical protein
MHTRVGMSRVTGSVGLMIVALIHARGAEPPQENDAPPYACNLVIGYSQVAQWYPSFETVVDDSRWELLWQGGAGVDRWSNPDYEGWSQPIRSPCRVRSGDPERVVLSISGPYGDDVDQWTRKIQETIQVIRAKYKHVQQIVLQPVVGGPGTSRAARQHPFIVQAIRRVVEADSSGTVRAGPSPQVSSSDGFRDALGHLTTDAASVVGKQIGAHYRQLDAR